VAHLGRRRSEEERRSITQVTRIKGSEKRVGTGGREHEEKGRGVAYMPFL